MNIKEILNNKMNILAIITIVILILCIGGIAYSIYNNQKINTSTEPTNQITEPIEKPDGEEINIEELESKEEIIEEENVANENKVNETTKKEEHKNDTTTSKSNTPTYYIKVNYGAQVVNIYKKDDEGNYTVPVKAMICSTGGATPTKGVYSIPARWEWKRLIGYVWGHYTTQITGDILFHSVPYLENGNLASLEYWEYDKLGTKASLGCVRLTVRDAKWIYDNCAKGTKVEFYSSEDPGPLGKPSAKKISSYPEYLRNWDPTDPNSNNPWRTYKETTNSNENTESDKTQNNTTVNNTTNTSNTSTNTTANTTTNTTVNNTTANTTTNTTVSNTTTNTATNTTSNESANTTTSNKNTTTTVNTTTNNSTNNTNSTVNNTNTIK